MSSCIPTDWFGSFAVRLILFVKLSMCIALTCMNDGSCGSDLSVRFVGMYDHSATDVTASSSASHGFSSSFLYGVRWGPYVAMMNMIDRGMFRCFVVFLVSCVLYSCPPFGDYMLVRLL